VQEGEREESKGGYFYKARDKSGFPNCVNVRPIRLPPLLSAPFTQAKFICLCRGLKPSDRSRKEGLKYVFCSPLTDNS